jgi:hypothetical protein
MSNVPGATSCAHGSHQFHSCRCWSRRGGDIVVIIVPGIGKVEIAVESAADSRVNGDGKLCAIYSKARDADVEAWRWHAETPPTRKALVDLTDDEFETLKQFAKGD